MTFNTKKIAAVLRSAGLTVQTKPSKNNATADEYANVQLIDAKVLIIQTFSVMGFGCNGKPEYQETKEELMNRVKQALNEANIEFKQCSSDLLFLNDYTGS